MTVLAVVDQLRLRYFACKGPRHVLELERLMNISRMTLARFARGGHVSLDILDKIETWVEEQEGQRGIAHHG